MSYGSFLHQMPKGNTAGSCELDRIFGQSQCKKKKNSPENYFVSNVAGYSSDQIIPLPQRKSGFGSRRVDEFFCQSIRIIYLSWLRLTPTHPCAQHNCKITCNRKFYTYIFFRKKKVHFGIHTSTYRWTELSVSAREV
jgi:hypothetical protein